MKTVKNFIIALIVSGASVSFGQTSAQQPSSTQNGDPQLVTDQAMSQKLSSDLGTRNSQLGNNPVEWYSTGNGYYGSYSVGDKTYMSRYDQQGKFQNTYTKGDWSGPNTPAPLKSSFDKSEYKGQQVTGFWTSADNSGYYLETTDKNGKVSRVYSDQSGKFSSAPAQRQKGASPK